MQFTKGTWHIHEQCVPGSLSSSPAHNTCNKANTDSYTHAHTRQLGLSTLTHCVWDTRILHKTHATCIAFFFSCIVHGAYIAHIGQLQGLLENVNSLVTYWKNIYQDFGLDHGLEYGLHSIMDSLIDCKKKNYRTVIEHFTVQIHMNQLQCNHFMFMSWLSSTYCFHNSVAHF